MNITTTYNSILLQTCYNASSLCMFYLQTSFVSFSKNFMMQVDHASEQIKEEPPVKKIKISKHEAIDAAKSPESLSKTIKSVCEIQSLESDDSGLIKCAIEESQSKVKLEQVESPDNVSGVKASTEDKSVGEAPKAAQLVGPVSEDDVGITEYISTHEGFSAIIKQRLLFNRIFYKYCFIF